MVYIRNKKVKGIDYAYLVQSEWVPKRNISIQHTIKYLGKASKITIKDIPEEYRNNANIVAYLSALAIIKRKEGNSSLTFKKKCLHC